MSTDGKIKDTKINKTMKQIFESGEFSSNRITDSAYNNLLTESRQFSAGQVSTSRTTIFLSHKHQDLDDLKDIIGLLQTQFNAKVYIDSMDASMPARTSGVTATRIKNIIDKSDKFILLATNNAIDSTWCNWELGYGDARKFRNNIAIFPIKPKGTADSTYKGHEYMQIYPHITKYTDFDLMFNGDNPRYPGYYVESNNSRISLQAWLNNR